MIVAFWALYWGPTFREATSCLRFKDLEFYVKGVGIRGSDWGSLALPSAHSTFENL